MSAAPEPRIRVLPAALADQIAAGEVVERPASVVKELAENALDAGATRVEVDVDGGGRRLIKIVDDGCGMTADEARLALRRHATSKIVQADDLWGVATFGFRGEALPSIAAVSRLALRTKVRGTTAGFRLSVEAGVETDASEIGMPDGTQIEVRDLFFNTPARLKFLKSEATEAANVSEAILRLALAHPEVHFKLRLGGRVALDLPPHRDLGERVRAGLARRGAGALHEARGQEGGHEVRAFLGAPEEASSTPRSTFLFVGRRFVRDRSLLHALAMGYGELLEKGRYPLAALFVEVPGRELDINVHPQKLEVRFSRAQEVYAAVRHVVGPAIARAPWLSARQGAHSLAPERGGSRLSLSEPAPPAFRPSPIGREARPPFMARDAALDVPSPPAIPSLGNRAGFFGQLVYVGQLLRTYLVCEGQGELVLVDQHAAHERIAFSKLRAQHAGRTLARQGLLFPIPITLDERAAATFESAAVRAAMSDLGFDAEPFGRGTLLLRAVPELLKDVDPKPLLLDILHRLGDESGPALVGEALDHVLATMACHSVVRAGDPLGREQAQALLAQLDGVDGRSHCPHGRPVLLRMPAGEIERRFGRT